MNYTELLKNIKGLVDNPNTSLEQVLKIDCLSFFFNQGMPSLIQFLISKSDEMLDISLNSPDRMLRTRAYDIVCGDNSDLLISMISRKVITKFAEKYMFDDSTDHSIIDRLIGIFERCFIVDYTQSSDQFYFITELVRFLDDQDVIGFFIDCADHPMYGKKFIQWLNELEFDERLIDTVQNEYSKEQNNPEFLYGLYSLIDKYAQHEEVLPRFLTPSKLSLIIQPCKHEMPEFVKISHAQMILDLCNEVSVPFVSDVINHLTKIVFEQTDINFDLESDDNRAEIEKNLNNIGKITELFLLSYQILIKIFTLSKDKKAFPLSILLDFTFHILNQYQSHSFALIVASNFIIHYSQLSPELRNEVISKFIPFAKQNLETNTNLNIIAFIYKIMVELKNKVDWSGIDKEEFDEIYAKYITPKKAIVDAEYGGKAPPPAEIVI